jgi:hypothetical protein
MNDSKQPQNPKLLLFQSNGLKNPESEILGQAILQLLQSSTLSPCSCIDSFKHISKSFIRIYINPQYHFHYPIIGEHSLKVICQAHPQFHPQGFNS